RARLVPNSLVFHRRGQCSVDVLELRCLDARGRARTRRPRQDGLLTALLGYNLALVLAGLTHEAGDGLLRGCLFLGLTDVRDAVRVAVAGLDGGLIEALLRERLVFGVVVRVGG